MEARNRQQKREIGIKTEKWAQSDILTAVSKSNTLMITKFTKRCLSNIINIRFDL